MDVKVGSRVQELPLDIDKVAPSTPRFSATELLPGFTCESGTYHTSLSLDHTSAQGGLFGRGTSTKEKPIGTWISRAIACVASGLLYWSSDRLSDIIGQPVDEPLLCLWVQCLPKLQCKLLSKQLVPVHRNDAKAIDLAGLW